MRACLSRVALIAGALGLALCAAPAAAQTRALIGGTETCGGLVESPNNMRLAWVVGYLSRAAYAHPGDMLDPVDADAVKAWITNFCRTHPLEKLSLAASTLEYELANRQAAALKATKP